MTSRKQWLECGGSGFIAVPHLRSVQNGEWLEISVARCLPATRYTCAVICECEHGQRRVLSHGHLTMTLGEYEMANPRWREQAEKYERQRAAKALLHEMKDIGFKIVAENGNVRVTDAPQCLSPDIRARLLKYKAEILEALAVPAGERA